MSLLSVSLGIEVFIVLIHGISCLNVAMVIFVCRLGLERESRAYRLHLMSIHVRVTIPMSVYIMLSRSVYYVYTIVSSLNSLHHRTGPE